MWRVILQHQTSCITTCMPEVRTPKNQNGHGSASYTINISGKLYIFIECSVPQDFLPSKHIASRLGSEPKIAKIMFSNINELETR